MDSSPEYPKRTSHFAHKLTRLLFKSCACQEIGHNAVLLIIHIAHTEDAARYQGPVRFWNSQLMETLGIRSRRYFIDIRQQAVGAGWLHYEREHDRSVGKYWATVPDSVALFDDTPIEESDSSRSPGEHVGTCSLEGAREGTRKGTREGARTGTPSYPSPYPSPDPEDNSCPRNKFTDEDLDLANWMLGLVARVQKPAKKPNLEKWANTIRLMREQDDRTADQIRDLFAWANDDSFWKSNIRSPEKLREKWDQLTIQKRERNGNANGKGAGRTGQRGRRGGGNQAHSPARIRNRS